MSTKCFSDQLFLPLGKCLISERVSFLTSNFDAVLLLSFLAVADDCWTGITELWASSVCPSVSCTILNGNFGANAPVDTMLSNCVCEQWSFLLHSLKKCSRLSDV